MFLKVKLIFASVLMYHLWAFREARVRICLKNSNLSISTAQFSEKMPRIHNIPKKRLSLGPTPSPYWKLFFWIQTCASWLIQGRWLYQHRDVTLESRNLRAPINHNEMWLFSQKKMASKSKTLPFPRDYRKEQNVNCHIHQSLTEWHKDPMINKNEKEENCKFKQILPSLGLNYPSRDNFWGRMHN